MNNRRYAFEFTAADLFDSAFKKSLKNRLIQSNYSNINNATLDNIASILISLYEYHIIRLTRHSMHAFADSLAKIIHETAIKNKNIRLEQFCHEAMLHYLILLKKHHLTHEETYFFKENSHKNSHKSFLIKSGIYCKENNQIYATKHTRAEEYGLIIFTEKKSWRKFKMLMSNETYLKLPASITNNLTQNFAVNMREKDKDFSKTDYEDNSESKSLTF